MPGPTIALTYNGYVVQMATLAVYNYVPASPGVPVVGVEPFFNALIPQMLNYAELRIQRDVDLMALQTSGPASYPTAIGSGALAIPVADFVTVQTLARLDPSGAGTPLTPASKAWLQAVYGAGSTFGPPLYYAPIGGDQATAGQTSNRFLLGPIPDLVYGMNVTGTIRMPSLGLLVPSDGTGTTFIATWLPDLLIAASMIYITAAQRNFGAASSDPQMGMSWEGVYQTALASEVVEEAKKHFEGAAWTSRGPAPVAAPTPRG
jgi:hypothetical protein